MRAYNVPDGPGCLAELASAVIAKHATEGIEAYREVAGSAVLDVLLAAVGDDDDLFLEGDAVAVLAKIDPRVFSTLSGHFIGSVMHRALLRELPPLDEREAPVLRDAAQERADFIIDRLEDKFKGTQALHRQMLKLAAENEDWFEAKLRQEID